MNLRSNIADSYLDAITHADLVLFQWLKLHGAQDLHDEARQYAQEMKDSTNITFPAYYIYDQMINLLKK